MSPTHGIRPASPKPAADSTPDRTAQVSAAASAAQQTQHARAAAAVRDAARKRALDDLTERAERARERTMQSLEITRAQTAPNPSADLGGRDAQTIQPSGPTLRA
ncbi:hypothetical protein [Plantibacter sp. RU18]|uniref:hypothetical protein n=1 Tax=Plantibacter sp. RU18 TaxID=3158143 RepID=UPI003D368B53